MKKYLIVAALFICLSSYGAVVENLRCEYLKDPLGIDILSPRLSWIMTSDQRGDFQSAYQIMVASSSTLLNSDHADIWDSGKITSVESIHINYQGKPLQAAGRYFWKVRIWDKNGKPSGWSRPAFWSMGLLSPDDWHNACWIAYKESDQWKKEWEAHKDAELRDNVFTAASWPWLTGKDSSIFALYEMAEPKYDPSPLFRKEFQLTEKINAAHLYICGLGYYEAFINGKRVGDHVLDPAWTNYEQQSMYVTYDITDLLRRGENAIGVMLGRGQYNPLCNDIWGLYKSAWIDQPKLIAVLDIEYADGTHNRVITDDTWKTSGGPVIYDDTRHGELYDARLEQEGWSGVKFDDSQWKKVSVVSWDASLKAQMIPPIRCFEPVNPVKTYQREGGITLYDIGETIAGWAHIRLKGPAGSKVLVEYCETPSDNELVPNLPPSRFKYELADKHYASFYDKGVNVRQQNGYILSGKGAETVECRFSYKGFRFIRITADTDIIIEQVEGIPVHTDMEITGTFTCSNPVINQIQKNAVNSLLSNYHSIATDCPHREKQGWTADNYMSAQAAMYNFNMASFFSKWLTDLAGTQDGTGGLCTVAPSTGYDMAVSTAWPAAIVYLPWDIYRFYADKQAMEEQYEVMKAFAKSSLNREVSGKPEIINEVLGDWLAPVMELSDTTRNNTMAPPEGHLLYGTAAHFRVVKRLSEIARVLGKDQDAKEMEAWSQRIAESFNNEFFDPHTGTYHGDKPTGFRQAANIVPLEYGIVPREKEEVVFDNLLQDIRKKGERLSTGFLGTPALMEYLPQLEPQLAYTLASHTNYPGWGYMIKNGATSMWEDWDGYASRNHTPYCLISSYFYKYLAGIQYDMESPGFKHIVINPSFENDLTYVDAWHDCLYGRIKSSWKRENGIIIINITIPANTSATVYLPGDPAMIRESGKPVNGVKEIEYAGMENGKAKYRIGAGDYCFEVAK